MKRQSLSRKDIIYLVLGAVVLLWGLNNIGYFMSIVGILIGIVSPFLIGGGIAFLLNLIMRPIERVFSTMLKKTRIKESRVRSIARPLSIVLTIVILLSVLGGMIAVVLPKLGETAMSLQSDVKDFLVTIQEENKGEQTSQISKWLETLGIDLANLSKEIIDTLRGAGGEILSSSLGVVTSVFSSAATFGIAFVFAVYLLAGKEQFTRQTKRMMNAYFSEKSIFKMTDIVHLIDDAFSSFFRGQFLEACILGLMFLVGMTIFRFPYAGLVSVLVTITALVPIFGAFIACIIGTLLMLVNNPMQAVWFVIFFLAMQQIEGNFIYPHVMGSRVGLPSIWILVAVTLGGSMFGIVGMLLFIPTVSVIYALLRQDIDRKIKAKQAHSAEIPEQEPNNT